MTQRMDRLPGLPDGLAGFLLVLPWVQPWAPGPQSNTVPWLVSGAVLALLLALAPAPGARMLARTWAWAALLGSAMGLLQYFGLAQHLSGWVFVPDHLGEAMGNLRQRNQLATLTSIGAVAVLWWHRQGLAPRHGLWTLALLAAGNAATASRTGLLQWLVLPALLALWQWTAQPRRPVWSWPLLLWALGMYLLASLLLPQSLFAWQGIDASNALFRMGENNGCSSRRVLWDNVLYLIGQRPWTGWGWGELKYAHYITPYPGERFCEILGHAHNLPLHLAVTLGLPVAGVLIAGAGVGVLRARPWRADRPEASLAWGVIVMIGLHSLLEFPLWYGPFQLALLGAVLLLWPNLARGWARHRSSVRAVAIGALCVMALVAYDYQRVRQIYLPLAQRVAVWADDPWGAAGRTWFFGSTVAFARVTSTPVTPDNAAEMLEASQALLHYSPEPRVVRQLIDSAQQAGHEDLARWHRRQLQVVYGERP